MPGDSPTGRLAPRPQMRHAIVDDRAVAVTTAFTGRPADMRHNEGEQVATLSQCACLW